MAKEDEFGSIPEEDAGSDMTGRSGGMGGTPKAEGEDGNGHSTKTRIMAGTVTAERVNVNGVVGVSRSGQDASLKGASGAVIAGHDANVTGGAAAFVARGSMNVTGGGGPVMVAGGTTNLTKGGAAVVVTRKATVADGGIIGIALARRVKVKEGGRVLITALPAVLMGLAIGASVAVVSELVRGLFTPRRPWQKSPAQKASAQLERRARVLARRGERLAEQSTKMARARMKRVQSSARSFMRS